MVYAILKKFSSSQYFPLNRLEVSKKKLIENYHKACLINKKIKVAPVLKSNAYGHGLEIIGKVIDSLNPPFICVDSIFEAYRLLKIKVRSKILIMGYVDPENLKFKKLPFSYAVSDINQFNNVLKYQPQSGIHVFVDTGMHREGILLDDLDKFLKGIPKEKRRNIEGIMSHLAASEEPENKYTLDQVKNFRKALMIFKNNRITTKWQHLANSYGLTNSKVLKIDNVSNLARVGLFLYNKVGRLFTHVIQIKKLKKGDKVGYNFTYTADKDIVMAVMPIGYNDGVDRGYSNKGRVFIKGTECPIIGRVSMNITVVDVSDVKNIKVNDVAEVDYMYPLPKRIPYQSMIGINPELKRVLVD